MSKTLVTIWRIHQGPDEHIWFTSDPPVPVGRYKLVRIVIVNDKIFEAPTEQEMQHLLPEEYSSGSEAQSICQKLNTEWFLTDPNWEKYIRDE